MDKAIGAYAISKRGISKERMFTAKAEDPQLFGESEQFRILNNSKIFQNAYLNLLRGILNIRLHRKRRTLSQSRVQRNNEFEGNG